MSGMCNWTTLTINRTFHISFCSQVSFSVRAISQVICQVHYATVIIINTHHNLLLALISNHVWKVFRPIRHPGYKRRNTVCRVNVQCGPIAHSWYPMWTTLSIDTTHLVSILLLLINPKSTFLPKILCITFFYPFLGVNSPLYPDSRSVPNKYTVRIRSTVYTQLVLIANTNGMGGNYMLTTMFTLLSLAMINNND